MAAIDRPMSEAEWRARDDARTLAQAEQIKADQARMSAAQTAAQKMLDEERKETAAIAKVAGRRTSPGSPSRSRGGSRGGKLNVFQRIG